MPRIPLYNQGLGPGVELAAQRLSPEASTAAFTAPGRALAGFAEQAGDVAFRFGMAERNSQDKRILKEENLSANEFFANKVLQDQSTDTDTAKANMKSYREEYLGTLESKGYNSRRMELVMQEVDAVFGQKNIAAQQNAFNRHLKLATDTDNEAIEVNLQAVKVYEPGTPEHDRALANIDGIFANAKEEGRILNKTQTEVQQEAILGRAQTRFNAANTVAEVNAIYAELAENKTIDPAKLATAQKVKTQKNKEILDGIESTLNLGFSEAETIAEAEALAKEFNDNPFVTDQRRARVNTNLANTIARIENNNAETALELMTENDFTAGSLTLAAAAAEKGESVVVETVAGDFITLDFSAVGINNQISLKNNVDALASEKTAAKSDAYTNSLLNAYETGGLDKINMTAEALVTSEPNEELVEKTLYNTSLRTSNDAELAMNQGNIELAEQLLSASNALLENDYGDRPSLRNQGGTVGNQAAALRNVNGRIQASINSKKAEAQRIGAIESSIESGTVGLSKHLFKPDELQAATDNVLSRKKTLNEKLSVLANNDLTSEYISGVVTNGYKIITNPNVDVESEQFIKTAEQSYMLYQNMNQFGAGLVNNHTTQDERLFFNTVESLVVSGGQDITQAIKNVNNIMRREYTLDETSKFNKEVTRQVDNLIDEKSNIYWWGNTEIRNEDYVKTEMIQLATLYRKMDMPLNDSIELAKQNLGSTHMNLNGVFVPKDKNYPPNIEQLVKLAAISFVDANSSEDMELSVNDVFLYPVPYQTGEFMVMYGDTGMPASEFKQTTWTLAELIELGQTDIEEYKQQIIANQAISQQGLIETEAMLEQLANDTLYNETKKPYGSAFAFSLEMEELARAEQEAQ
jgi:hypothetical protein